MLSIIISSYQEKFYTDLGKNIAETIGLEYEILKIHNPGLMGICEAYNKGAANARYDYLLFIHEDILFHTQNWGKKLIHHLNQEGTGVIGLAGSNYVPKAPTSWNVSNDHYNFVNLNKDINAISQTESISKQGTKIFALDGLFMAVKKEVYNQFLFDEKLKGFHGYDTDFSLRVATKFSNDVIWDINVTHFSGGNRNKAWLDNHIQIRKKINYRFNEEYNSEVEIPILFSFIKMYFSYYSYNPKNILQVLRFFPKITNIKANRVLFKTCFYYLIKNISHE